MYLTVKRMTAKAKRGLMNCAGSAEDHEETSYH